MVKLAVIFFTMILVDNYVLAKFLGICPFLGVSKKLDSAVGMSCLLYTSMRFPVPGRMWWWSPFTFPTACWH